MEPDIVSEVQQLTPAEFESRVVYCQTHGLLPERVVMQFPTTDTANMFQKYIEQDDRLEADSSESSESEEDDLVGMKFCREVIIDEKEAYLLSQSYADRIKEIQSRLNVRVILTAKKIKIFSTADEVLIDAQKEMRYLTQKIFVFKIHKSGKEIHESDNCHKQLEPIKTLEWKNAYYYYFDASQLDEDTAKEKMSKINKLSHLGFYLMPRYDGPMGFMYPIRQLYIMHTKRHLFNTNSANKLEYQLEISTTAKRVLFHSNNQHIIRNMSEQLLAKLRRQTLLFFFKIHPKVTKQAISNLDAKIKKKSKQNEYFKHIIKPYREFYTVGILISKAVLKSILKEEKNAKTFGSIIESIINESQLSQNSIYFYFPFKSQNLTSFFQNNFSKSFKIVGSQSQVTELVPKIIEDGYHQMYLQVLKKMLQFKDQYLKDSNVSFSNSSIDQTSIINDTNNQSMESSLSKSILPSFVKSKFPRYDANLNLQPTYEQISQKVKADKLDKEVASKVEKLIGKQCSVRKVKVRQDLKSQGTDSSVVTLFIEKKRLFSEKQCNLYKLVSSLEIQEGYLVQVNVSDLKEEERFFRAKTAENYIPTHYVNIHLD